MKPCLLVVTTLVVLGAAAQEATPRPKFWDEATIKKTDNRVVVEAYFPRPLEQALDGIAKQYGWVVDYEDPVYAGPDIVGDTDPAWRKANPDKKGVTRVAGGLFHTSFSLGTEMSAGSADEERVLNQVVTDYNASGNPGRFMVVKEINDRFAVVGIGARDANGNSKESEPILDGQIALPPQEGNLSDVSDVIARLLSKHQYVVCCGASAPMNLLLETTVKIGGTERPARDFLAQVASADRYAMEWRLLYDPDWNDGTYFLNFEIAQRAKPGTFWNPIRTPAKK